MNGSQAFGALISERYDTSDTAHHNNQQVMAAASALSLSCSSLALLGRQALRQGPQYALRLRLQHPLQAYILQKDRALKARANVRMNSQMPATRLVLS